MTFSVALRVCWRGMTDADYHSRRKPITLVITAPGVPLGRMKRITDFSAHPPGKVFFCVCVSSVLIPPVEVLIVQSMGPSRASEPSLAAMSFCFTKQGGRAS